jgi:hypothetical protein
MLKRFLCFFVLVALTFTIASCTATSSDDDSSGTSVSYREYSGAAAKGDIVSCILGSDNTLVINNSTTEEVISANYRSYTFPGLDISCYEAYNISVDGVASDETVPFIELEGTALIAYIPNGTDNDLAMYNYTATPVLDGTLDGDYLYLDVITSNVAPASYDMGEFAFAMDKAGAENCTYATPTVSHSSPSNLQLTITGNYITVPAGSSTYTCSVSPAGVIIIDKGPNMGALIGVKKPAADYTLDSLVGNTYIVLTSGGTMAAKVTIKDGGLMDLDILEFSDDSVNSDSNIAITQIKPGLFSANLGGGDSIKFALLGETAFFGIHYDPNSGMCNDNFIGLKTN